MTLENYLKLEYRFEIIPDLDEGGYVISYPDLPGCLSIGDTIEEAIENGNDAKKEWMISMFEDKMRIPFPNEIMPYNRFIKVYLSEDLYNKLTKHAKEQRISLNHYCVYLLAKGDDQIAILKNKVK